VFTAQLPVASTSEHLGSLFHLQDFSGFDRNLRNPGPFINLVDLSGVYTGKPYGVAGLSTKI
jgi:hypothetical protein